MSPAARIGMITPSSNTCLEPTTYRILGAHPEVTVHFARVPVTRIAVDAGSDQQFRSDAMVAAARQLADARVDVVVWNGTAGSWLGADHDHRLTAEIAAATGVPATTSTLAMLAAFDAYDVHRLGLATPYTADVNERIVAVYLAEGVDVLHDSALGISDNEAFARVPPSDVATQLRAVGAGVDGVAVLCTNVYGAALAEPLEAELGVPVFDSVAITLWHALRLAGRPLQLPGYGTVLLNRRAS
ncbi:aspartate/glutamate racemase family protein [Kribbella sp. NPDC059898]|uniref:maleate cis-trans isomerase family protein n=1 Tax=Kribbella sp. NPDC059898 TaxID=3346995 RepID=UPI003652C776